MKIRQARKIAWHAVTVGWDFQHKATTHQRANRALVLRSRRAAKKSNPVWMLTAKAVAAGIIDSYERDHLIRAATLHGTGDIICSNLNKRIEAAKCL
jgi:hypothetical protein